MDKFITIYNGTTEIKMPRARYSIGGEEVSKSVTMASGKIVKDIIGTRKVIEIEWDYVPMQTFTNLMSALHSNSFLQVKYQDLDGTEKVEYFESSIPTSQIFKFNSDGKAMWHSVKLKLRGQEVTS